MAVIVIKLTRRRVIGDVHVETTILVVVEPKHTQAIVGLRIDIQFFRYVRKRAIAIVVVKVVTGSFYPPRTTGNRDSTILAERTITEFRKVLEIQIDVINDIQDLSCHRYRSRRRQRSFPSVRRYRPQP